MIAPFVLSFVIASTLVHANDPWITSKEGTIGGAPYVDITLNGGGNMLNDFHYKFPVGTLNVEGSDFEVTGAPATWAVTRTKVGNEICIDLEAPSGQGLTTFAEIRIKYVSDGNDLPDPDGTTLEFKDRYEVTWRATKNGSNVGPEHLESRHGVLISASPAPVPMLGTTGLIVLVGLSAAGLLVVLSRR